MGSAILIIYKIAAISGVADFGYGFAPLAPQFWGEQEFQSFPQDYDPPQPPLKKLSRVCFLL
ncbi:hypothetical protein BJP34_10875 [Moorena producens PAL-8-15-08-1]|uniref:Uncharacterized protein n=1 Tax=Moorena producens PAL-8-15-08-1 TaxID=1458985 RepID=A0A1D8TQF7_9CYAN|nr:hypothetical protein BJP34_10875 [Moorena producens PAL-8-15-08-1]